MVKRLAERLEAW